MNQARILPSVFGTASRLAKQLALLAGLLFPFVGSSIESPTPTNSPAWKGSAALFVGVGQFESDSGLGTLRFAPDDAVALAYLFVGELRLLPAKNAWIALSGDPVSAQLKERLQDLKARGVQIVPAERKTILKSVKSAAEAASDSDGLLLLSICTHGYERNGHIVLMPSDGQVNDLETSGVPLDSLQNTVSKARAGKRLMFIDACRQISAGPTRGEDTMPDSFYKALAASSGFGLLASCSKGQKSWEDEKLGHGVFTYFLLEALRGKAEVSPQDGIIHLREVANYTTDNTKDYAWRLKSSEQFPWVTGDPSAWNIPLAMDPGQREKTRALKVRADQSLAGINEARRNIPGVMSSDAMSQLVKVLDAAAGPELERLVPKMEEVASHKTDRVALEDFAAWFRGKYPSEQTSPVVIREKQTNSAPVSPTPAPVVPVVTTPQAKPSLWIQFDPVGQGVTRLWSTALTAQLRDQLSQALRDRGKFDVKSGSARPEIRSSSRNNVPGVDYILNLRVDEFDHRLEQVKTDLGIFKVSVNSYKPRTTLAVGWALKRSTDNSELKTDSAKASQDGKSLSIPPNKRATTQTLARDAEWADAAVLTAVANQIATAVSQLSLQP